MEFQRRDSRKPAEQPEAPGTALPEGEDRGAPPEPTGRMFLRLPERTRAAGGVLYDTLEIAPVIPLDADGTCEALEDIEDVPPEDRGRIFWSLYGHIPGQGCECVGDFTTGSHALEVTRRLFGDVEHL